MASTLIGSINVEFAALEQTMPCVSQGCYLQGPWLFSGRNRTVPNVEMEARNGIEPMSAALQAAA